MSAIRVENLSKRYRLGVTHAGSVRELANRIAGGLLGRKSSSHSTVPVDAERIDDGYFYALRDVSFTIEPGEVVGIIGKNGAGKSTLLKILSRISGPTSGRITLRGRVASLLEVGTGFHPELTGRENIYLNGTILGMTRREITSQFAAIVDFAGIEKFIDTPVKRYSSGMTVRLGFAVAAHLNPEILIVDEVLAVGDAEFQKKCLGKMQEVSASGRTVLFVSHNMASIRALTHNCLLISRGELLYSGPTGNAVQQYLDQNLQRLKAGDSIADLERPFEGLGRQLEIVSLALSHTTIEEGESTTLQLGVHSRTVQEDFYVGMTINRVDGSVVGGCFSPVLSAEAIGKVREFNLRLPTEMLAPGRYCCSISIGDHRSYGKRLLDSLSEVLAFEVLPGGLDSRGWHHSWGAVRLGELSPVTQGQREAATSGR
jgi:lipopolysaccharide transport system ATP-binding protein